MNEITNSIIIPLLNGAGLTLKLFFITLIFSIPLGLLLALARISRFNFLSKIINAYIWLMRGTPLLLQLFFIYFTLPLVSIVLPAFLSAAIAFILNYAAYFAEIFRAGIQSINKGQFEAAKALGISFPRTMQRIIMPQVIKRILPPISNETITLVKDTSLVYIVTLNDLFRITYNVIKQTGNTMPFIIAALFYLIMTFILTLGFQKLEKYYGRYED